MFKKIISVFLTVLMMTSVLVIVPPEISIAQESGVYVYRISGDKAIITRVFTIIEGAVEIPERLPPVTGYLVAGIDENAFKDCTKITSLKFPSGLKEMFNDIGFSSCSGITAFTVADGNTAFKAEDGVLFNMDKTKVIYYPAGKTTQSYVMPSTVRTIGMNSFKNASLLTNVTIGENVSYIDRQAFRNTGLTSVIIPNSVTKIEHYAFTDCNQLVTLSIGNSVQKISEYTFYGCRSLLTINIPNSVTTIERNAFQDCISATSATLGTGVKYIRVAAFRGCNKLVSINIPNTVATISDETFQDCHALATISIPDTVTSIGYDAFKDCVALKSVIIPNNVTSIGDGAFQDCNRLLGLTIGEAVTSIGARAFMATGLTTVTIPDKVTSLEDDLFRGVTFLANVTIGSEVVSISDTAFVGCSYLVRFVVSENNLAFESDQGVLCSKGRTRIIRYPSERVDPNYVMPDTVVLIDKFAFNHGHNLRNLTIGAGITRIDPETLYDLKHNLASIHVDANNTAFASIDGVLFNKEKNRLILYPGNNPNASYDIPAGVINIDTEAFLWPRNLYNLTIPDGVTTLVRHMIYSPSGGGHQMVVTIPSSVTSIENYALDFSYIRDGCDVICETNTYAYEYARRFLIYGFKEATIVDLENLNLAAPVVGGVPTNATSTCQHYGITSTTWSTGGVDLVAGAKFEANKVYTATVVLETRNSNGKFADRTRMIEGFTKKGELSADRDVLTLQKTFILDIEEAVVGGIVDPIKDADQTVANVDPNAKYSATAKWYKGSTVMDAADKFKTGIAYKVEILLTAQYGYRFTNTTAIPIGYTRGAMATDGTTLIIEKTFMPIIADAITAVSVTNIADPVIGAAQAAATVDTAAPYTATTTKWYKGISQVAMAAADKFEAISVYKVEILLTAMEGHKFTDTTTIPAGYTKKIIATDGMMLIIEKTFAQTPYDLITTVGLTALANPVTGADQTVAVSADAIKYTAASTKWYKGSSSIAITSTDKFDSSSIYKVEIMLTSKYSYKFTDATTIPAGYTKTATSIDGTTLMIEKTFSATEANPIIAVRVTGLVDPAMWANQTLAVSSDESQYTATTKWYKGESTTPIDSTDKFEPSSVYKAEILLTARFGYKFTDITATPMWYIKGDIAADGTTLTIVKTFPITETNPIAAVTITGILDPVTDAEQTAAIVDTAALYTVTTTKWYKGATAMANTDKFAANSIHKVEIVLTAKTGNKFTTATTFTGYTKKEMANDGTTLTLEKIFTSTKYIDMDMNGDDDITIADALLALKKEITIIPVNLLADPTNTALGILNTIIQ